MREAAVDKVIFCVSPNLNDHKGSLNRNLTGKVNTRTPLSLTGNQITLPSYLRAPASSCHDFCKYGKKHETEAKKKNIILRKSSVKQKIMDKACNRKNMRTLLDGKVCNKKASIDLIECLSEESLSMNPATSLPVQMRVVTLEQSGSFPGKGSCEDPESDSVSSLSARENVLDEFFEESGSIKLETPTNIEEKNVSIGGLHSTWLDGSAILEMETPPPCNQSEGSSMDSLILLQKVQSSAVGGPSDQAKQKQNSRTTISNIKPKVNKHVNCVKLDGKQKIGSIMLKRTGFLDRVKDTKKSDESGDKNSASGKSMLVVEQSVGNDKPKWANMMHMKGGSDSSSPISIKKKTFPPPERIQLSPKPSVLLKLKAPSQKGSSSLEEGTDLKTRATSVSSKYSHSQTLTMNSGKQKSLKCELETRKVEFGNEKFKEKTINAVKKKLVGAAPKPIQLKPRKLSSRQSLTSPSASVLSNNKEDNEESKSTLSELRASASRIQCAKGNPKNGQIKTNAVMQEDKLVSVCKVTFRQGKFTSPQRERINQRRLSFRQARDVAHSRNVRGGMEMTNYGKKKEPTGSNWASSASKTPAVVLRHQGLQEKKDSQSLYNDVIEETASKLVESRKSKVKALVGAFETVISLHERA